MAYLNNLTLSQIIETPETNSQHFESAVGISADIDAAIQRLVDSSDASGALVRQFHNGRRDLTGLPFTYVSTTYISLANPNQRVERAEFESYPISTGSITFGEMWQVYNDPQCVTHKVADIRDPILASSFASYRFNYVVICPLTNLLKYPMGVLVVGYNYDPGEKQITATKDVANSITGYLNSIQGEDKKNFLDFMLETMQIR